MQGLSTPAADLIIVPPCLHFLFKLTYFHQYMSQKDVLKSFLEGHRVGGKIIQLQGRRKNTHHKANVINWQITPVLKICQMPFYNNAVKVWARGQGRTRVLSVLALLVRMGFPEELSMNIICPGVKTSRLSGAKAQGWEEPWVSMKFSKHINYIFLQPKTQSFTFWPIYGYNLT